MSFTGLNGDAMDLPFAKQEPIDSTCINLTTESTTSKVKAEPNDGTGSPVPTSTPQKRRARKSMTNANNDSDNEAEQESPTKKSKTKSPGKRAGPLGPIPTSYEEAGPEDRMILRMKETDRKGWTEIQQALEEITGSKLGGSTLRVRYTRLKASFVVFEREDESRLLQARKEVEEKMEHEKWQRIADTIEMKGGKKYPTTAIQKKFKELTKRVNGSGVVAAAVEEE